MLLLMREGDPRNLQCTNQLFVDDPTGRCELAGWIRLLADRASLIEPRDSEWYRWCVLPGLRACWTAHIRELWFPGESGSLDVRAVVAEEDPAITAWVPRRALNQFIQTPDDLQNYRLSLLEEHGQVRAVRIEELGGFDPESLGFIQVGVLLAVDAGVQDEQLPQSPFGQP